MRILFMAVMMWTMACLKGFAIDDSFANMPLPQLRPPLPQDELTKQGMPAADKASPSQSKRKPRPEYAPPFDLAAAKSCEAELKNLGVMFKVLSPLNESGCGTERPLLLANLPKGITLAEPKILRCQTALSLANWTLKAVLPAAKLHLKAKLKQVDVGTHYMCRRRNNRPTGKFSEHAFANAVDISGFQFASGKRLAVKPRSGGAPESVFQATVRAAACDHFTTVLGPGSNAAHADHFHFDTAYRRSGYRLCE